MTSPADATTADSLVTEARRAVHESLTFLAAPEADRVRSLIADLETAVEGRTAIRMSAPVPSPPADRSAGEPRTQLLHALDFSTCLNAGYGEPEELLAAYDASRTPPSAGRIAEAALAAVEAALGDTLVPAAREEALAGIVAVLPPPADRAAVLREAADRIDREDLPQDDVDMFDNGARWATKLLRRMADEIPAAEAQAWQQEWDSRPDGADVSDLVDLQPAETYPPAASGLPAGTLEAAEIGANRLDAWARSPQGRNFLAHALVQLARTGWLRTEPGEPFEPMREDAPSPEPDDESAAGARQDGAQTTALDVLRCLANPEPCAWEGVYCITHSWKSDIGRCPHGQAQVLLGGGR